jgi:pyruvate/2-oxoglutarate/acetoin dehydrogenase E1 component
MVVAPSCPNSAAQLLTSAMRVGNPVIFTEHRWLQSMKQNESKSTEFEIGQAKVRKEGQRITVVTWSYGVVEALRFSEIFPEADLEIVDLLSLSPLDMATVLKSVRKTGRLIVWEPAWSFGGIGAEILARVLESGEETKVLRIGYPQENAPSSVQGARNFYPALEKITAAINRRFDLALTASAGVLARWPVDQDMPDWNPFAHA